MGDALAQDSSVAVTQALSINQGKTAAASCFCVYILCTSGKKG